MLSPRRAYLISGPKRRGQGILERELNREAGGGGGSYSKSYTFDKIHNNISNFSITAVTETEQETGFVSPFYKCNVFYTLTQAGKKMKFQRKVTETQRILLLERH